MKKRKRNTSVSSSSSSAKKLDARISPELSLFFPPSPRANREENGNIVLFFQRVVKRFKTAADPDETREKVSGKNKGMPEAEGSKRSFSAKLILVNHIVPTLLPFLKGADEIGEIALIIPKGSSHDENVLKKMEDKYSNKLIYNHSDLKEKGYFHSIHNIALSRGDITESLSSASEIDDAVSREKDETEKMQDQASRSDYREIIGSENVIDIIKTVVNNNNFLIIDIGGYFAAQLQEITRTFQTQFLGVVEDTENGHQKYIASFKKEGWDRIEKPRVFSVARSDLKKTEDYNVGKSIVESASTILRINAHAIIERMDVIGVIGFGKIGRSIAEHLRQKNIKKLIVYDSAAVQQMEASSLGFKVVNKQQLLKKADMIFCATGNKALKELDFYNLKDNVYIASCTSSDDEFAFGLLGQYKIIRKDQEKAFITQYVIGDSSKKNINLLVDGNAVNFIFGAVNGPYIYSVQAGLIVAALKLIDTSDKKSEKKRDHSDSDLLSLSSIDCRDIAKEWLKCFDRYTISDLESSNLDDIITYCLQNIGQSRFAYLEMVKHFLSFYEYAENVPAMEYIQHFLYVVMTKIISNNEGSTGDDNLKECSDMLEDICSRKKYPDDSLSEDLFINAFFQGLIHEWKDFCSYMVNKYTYVIEDREEDKNRVGMSAKQQNFLNCAALGSKDAFSSFDEFQKQYNGNALLEVHKPPM